MLKEFLLNENIPILIVAYTFLIYSGLLYMLHRAEQPMRIWMGIIPIPFETKTWGLIKVVLGSIILFAPYFEDSGIPTIGAIISTIIAIPFYYYPISCYFKGEILE